MEDTEITESPALVLYDADGVLIPEEGRSFDVTVTRDGVESVQSIVLRNTLVGLYSAVRGKGEGARSQAETFATSAVYAGYDTEEAILAAHPDETTMKQNGEGRIYSLAYRLIDQWRQQGERDRNQKAVSTAKKDGSPITSKQRSYAVYLVGILKTYDATKVRQEIINILTTNEAPVEQGGEGGQRGALMDAIFRGRQFLAMVDPDRFGRRQPRQDDDLVVPGSTTTTVEGDQVADDTSGSNPDTTVTSDGGNEDPF